MKSSPWESKAACLGVDTNKFYTQIADMGYDGNLNLLCRRCPVINECLKAERDQVLNVREIWGFRGGMGRRARIRYHLRQIAEENRQAKMKGLK